jgi:hypothetical protein
VFAALALGALLVVLCLVAGRLIMQLLGASRPSWVEGAVGFAALTVLAALLVRLPGRATTAAVGIAVLLLVGIVVLRGALRPPPERRDGAQAGAHLAAIAVVAIVLLAAALPFLLEGRSGVLGEGVYTNDHAAQLYWTDWLQHGFGRQPSAVKWGYPVGPQSLVAAVAEGTGASLIDAFNGLLVAIPALTALAALALLGHLRPGARIVAASLCGLPFLAASFLAQSAFKETAMALLVLAFTAVLALAAEPEAHGGSPLQRRAGAGAGALIVLGGIFTYSVPALAWFVLGFAAWLALALGTGERRVDWAALREAVWRRRLALGIVLVALVGIAAVSAGRVSSFVERIGDVSASTGRLSSPIFPGEALAIWPEGDFRIVRGEVTGALAATLMAAVAVAGGAVVLWRRRSYAVLAALGSGIAIYLGARAFSSIYVEAKALAVMAPLAVVVALGGLFATGRGGAGRALRALGVAFAIGAAISTFLALRATPVGFDERGRELEQLASEVQGEPVVFLGVDRFAAYWLRGTEVRSPGGYVPVEVAAREGKVWQHGRALDLDTLAPDRLDEFDYAITTTAAYQSSPPANMREVARTDSYVLWERTRRTPRSQVLDEGGAPGALLEAGESPLVSLACRVGRDSPGDGTATVLPEPVVGGPRAWSRPVPFAAPGTAKQTLELSPGRWQLSLQYHSQVGLSVRAAGLDAELSASLVGMYLTQQGQSAFWPVGEVEVRAGGELEVEVDAAEPAGLARAVGAERRVWLGEVAATRLDPLASEPQEIPLGSACDRYVDRYVPR